MDASVSWTKTTQRALPKHLKRLESESIEIMREVGFSDAEIAGLRDAKAIASS